ncbi:class I SAM-dependent DNA methyltransferase [Hyphomicrobium sp. MC1]|uniref:HsdM family class I SAM-dependent methyltransferase n=1 Tax=Hyphomicrobium sp. (strain MC1) TaxID=717785 RepID=UPI000213D7D5|nr:N-6 DNA methylase [Hyphomicrobium sp. MC1]CCB63753.1 putative N-6 DNA methylase [Hyphomicrobium sp. MC1]
MTQHFNKVLRSTGYLNSRGKPVKGLVRPQDRFAYQLRPIFQNDRLGLNADAVFTSHRSPTAIFKDAGKCEPTSEEVVAWHEAAWNVGVAPLLWLITPTEVRLYNCYEPHRGEGPVESEPLAKFDHRSESELMRLDEICGRLATETGAFWKSDIGQRIDRRFRVDRVLLDELVALEDCLTRLPSRLRSPFNGADEARISRDFAQRLIGRCIFTWYLFDRGYLGPTSRGAIRGNLEDQFSSRERAFELFAWLRETFNGDLFPMDQPTAERSRLSDAHLELIRDFIRGTSLVPGAGGQRRLFRFKFSAIPVDLVSSIYQQFSRSSSSAAPSQGLHYTPVELVHLVLDPVFEGLPPSAKVIDPTCGSGAFLVEAFRRLVWKSSGKQPPSRSQIRKVLYGQLYGIDINPAAIGVAAFSLYLAALELDEEPIKKLSDLRFERLIDRTLFVGDALSRPLPDPVEDVEFDAVVGNPPWTFAKGYVTKDDVSGSLPRRSPDQRFLAVSMRLAGANGKIGMVLKATPFFSRDAAWAKSRAALLAKLAPVALVNLSMLRKEGLFPDAVSPAILLFSRCVLMPTKDQMLIGSVAWTPDFHRTGVFALGPAELKGASTARILKHPPLLKAAAFGTPRDAWLIERLENECPTLEDLLKAVGVDAEQGRGQGFQVQGGDINVPPEEYYQLKIVGADAFQAFRADARLFEKFEYDNLHRPRSLSKFVGPLLLCAKAASTNAAERGRYTAAVVEKSVLYSKILYGISFAGLDRRYMYALSAVLNSSATAFQLAFGGAAWGLERPTVEPHELLNLRVPDLCKASSSKLNAVLTAEKAAAAGVKGALHKMDEAVCELFDLDEDERSLLRESVSRAKHLIFEGHRERYELVWPPSVADIVEYARLVTSGVDRYLRARGRRHMVSYVNTSELDRARVFGCGARLIAVGFSMKPGAPTDAPDFHVQDEPLLSRIEHLVEEQLPGDAPPYLSERRQLRVYDGENLFILKPAEKRYWSRTAALNDTDAIMADHWLSRSADAFAS